MTKPGKKPTPASERFHGKYRVMESGCWEWTGSISTQGYGRISENNRPLYAHRVSYEMHKGPIPDGLVVDHICRVRSCVNPDHLQAITNSENLLSGTAPTVLLHWLKRCKQGHDMTDPRNVYVRPDNGRRACHECIRQRSRKTAGQNRASA